MTKELIGLVIDEGTDLPKEIIEKNYLEVVPFKVDWPEVQSLPGENLYQKIREAEKRGIKTFAKTSQPAPKDFLDAFKKQLEKFEKIICITITSKHSGTYNSASQAKNFLDKEIQNLVFIFDSLNVSAGEAFLVLKAIELIKKGLKTGEEIIKELEKMRPKIYLRVIFKDPKWIEASGRVSHTMANWIRRAEKIGIRPLLGVKNGTVTTISIKAGAKEATTALFKELEEKTRKLRQLGKKIKTAIIHTDNPDGVSRLKEMIENNLKEVEIVFINLVNPIVGSIVGPDALALVWVED